MGIQDIGIVVSQYSNIPILKFDKKKILFKKIVYYFQALSKYYKGGFDAKMSKREAGLILGVRLVL